MECPTDLPGPELVRIEPPKGPAYCIDATEVTKAQYAAFVEAKPAVGARNRGCPGPPG